MDRDAGALYASSRRRLVDLLRELPLEAWEVPVPACPGWDVKAVVAHLVGIVEDALAGRLRDLPTIEQTAAQVARSADTAPARLLDVWADTAPAFEQVVSRAGVWPAALDVLTHEHDIRGAIGRPGDRDAEDVHLAARVLVERVELPAVTLVFDVGHDHLATVDAGGPHHVVRTSAFEVTRIRLGRRSPAQVLAMPWQPALAEVPGALFAFGPRDVALAE